MRRVQVSRTVVAYKGTDTYTTTEEWFIGDFCEYGVYFEELDEGIGNTSCAIVEDDEGNVHKIDLEMIKFIKEK